MNRAELVNTLDLLRPALASDNTVPIFQCFVFAGDKIYAYNDSLGIVGPSGKGFPTQAAFHGATFYGLLSSSSAEDVSFKLDGDQAVFTLGKTVSKLPFHDQSQFIFEVPEDSWEFELNCNAGFVEALGICLDTVSKDSTQAALNGVTIAGNHMFSCDGDALTQIGITDIGKNRAMLQTEFCNTVLNLCNVFDFDHGVISISSDWMRFQCEDWSVYGRVLQIADPIDFAGEVKKTLKGKKVEYKSLPDGFKGTLVRARVLADPESKKTRLTVKNNILEVFTETHMGEVKDEMPFTHADVVADVNAAYLQRALKYCDQVAIFDNCVLFRRDPKLVQLISNMG